MVSDAVRGMPGLRTRRLDQRRRRPSPRPTDVAARWGGTLAIADVADLRRRPAPDVWSPLEYACHTAMCSPSLRSASTERQRPRSTARLVGSRCRGRRQPVQRTGASPRRRGDGGQRSPVRSGTADLAPAQWGARRSVDQVNASPSEGWRVSCCTRWCITTEMPSSNSRRRRSSGRRRDEPHLVAKRSNRQPGTVTFDPDATLLKIFTDPETISDPYPLYAELRSTPRSSRPNWSVGGSSPGSTTPARFSAILGAGAVLA